MKLPIQLSKVQRSFSFQ